MKKDIKKEEVGTGAEASREMLKMIFDDIKRFKKFEDFLVSVQAMGGNRDNWVVYDYPLEDMQKYEDKYIKKYTTGSLNDSFIFSDKAKRYRKDENDKKKPTGTFMPRDFFVHILNRIKFDKK